MLLKNFFLVVFFSFLAVSVSLAASLRDGLVLHYSFDANTGSTIPDLSGAGHNGQVNGAVFASSGKFGGAYSFDGQDDYILAGNLGYQAAGTISFWMNAAALENYRNPFSTDFASWDDNIRFESSASGEFSGGGHGLGRGDVFMKTMEPSRWYHVVYIWDDKYVYGYLDGKLRFCNPHPDPSSKVHPDLPLTAGEYKQTTLALANVVIGNGYSTEPNRFWRGLIDEVRIYNRPLSPAEVKLLHQGRGDGLVLYYSFDADNGAVVRDQSGLGNDARVMNGASYTAEGRIAGGFRFDGADDYLLVGTDSSLNVGGEITIAAWFLAENSREGSLIEWGKPGVSGVQLRTRASGPEWGGLTTGVNLVDSSASGGAHIISAADPALNKWHHLAVTYSRTSGNAALYLDGLVVTQKDMGSFIPATKDTLAIGRSLFQSAAFSGRMDEVRVYNRALAPEEIRAMVDSLTHGKIYQDFENNNGTGDEYGWAINGDRGVAVSRNSAKKSSGTYSWKMTVPSGLSDWTGGTAVKSRTEQWNFKAEVQRHDRLSFRMLSYPQVSGPQTVKVKFFDHNKYIWDPANSKDGATVRLLAQAAAGGWSSLDVFFTQLPDDFDFGNIDKIEIYVQKAGTFYFDDIVVTSADRVYQSFEKRAGISVPDPAQYGWVWNGSAALTGSLPAEGALSWQVNAANVFPQLAGTGIKYQGKNFTDDGQIQDIWNVALLPRGMHSSLYATLALSVKQLGQNGLDNNIQAVFFDHSQNPSGVWTTRRGTYNEWTRFSIPLSLLSSDFNFQDVDKIEFSLYWPGKYFFDDIRVRKYPVLRIDESFLPGGLVTWPEAAGAVRYVLEQSSKGSRGPWTRVYTGAENVFKTESLSALWFRVRWESDANSARGTVAYISDWSESVRYTPAPVLMSKDRLNAGSVEWVFAPQAPFYEVQAAPDKFGPWSLVYKGPYQVTPLSARRGYWYRVRGFQKDESGAVCAYGEWSPALLYDPSAFVTADATALRPRKGSSRLLKLRGVNLGNYFLLEPWMFFGDTGDTSKELAAAYPDDYSIRARIKSRFGQSGLDAFLKTYRAAYLQESDLDYLMRNGFNLVRLPLYVQDIRPLDENGNWASSAFRFEQIDRIIKLCADRGLYVLLDLHGAPGYQSREFHSGRKNVNRLFDPANDVFRQRTVELWTALARRYRTNTAVLGYDLLNEPYGAVTPEYYPVKEDGYRALWSLYDRVYKAIRSAQSSGGAGDANHLIVMEGIPSAKDWESLPPPSAYAWQNVMYQHHYYGFTFDSEGKISGTMTYDQHKEYIDDKIRYSRQAAYQVPVLIGEFNGFGDSRIWNLLLNKFNAQGWHWSMWSNKIHDVSSEWGLFTHEGYDDAQIDPGLDTLDVLLRKASKYTTHNYHKPYQPLLSILKKAAELPGQIHNLSGGSLPGGVILGWSAPDSVSAPEAYRVYYGTVSGNKWDQIWMDDAVPGAIITGLIPGQAYQFRVQAITSQGVGPLSNKVRLTAMPYVCKWNAVANIVSLLKSSLLRYQAELDPWFFLDELLSSSGMLDAK